RDVEAGLLFSDALERHPKVFSQLYVAMVRAGEAGGVLEDCLMRVADQLEKDAALKRQVRAAMIYPALVITFAVIVLLALVAFRYSRPSRSPERPQASPSSSVRWVRSSPPSRRVARSPNRSSTRARSPRWSRRWSEWGRRRARSTRC